MCADAYPNFFICGIPYYVSGEVTHWRNLAHRTIADLEAAGMRLRLDTTARRIGVPDRKLLVTGRDGAEDVIAYDRLVIGTGAGYIGLEMAEALAVRGLAVTQIEQLPEVLPTIDTQLGAQAWTRQADRA